MKYPVLIKASAGGGGKGMRVVHDPAEFRNAAEAAKDGSVASPDEHREQRTGGMEDQPPPRQTERAVGVAEVGMIGSGVAREHRPEKGGRFKATAATGIFKVDAP